MKEPILLLFGDNLVAYNIAAAIDKTRYEVFCFLPSGARSLISHSHFIHRSERSTFPVDHPGYMQELVEFVGSIQGDGKVLTFLTSDQAISFWRENESLLQLHCSTGMNQLDVLSDKAQFYALLSELDLPHARVWNFGQTPVYPYVVKPCVKRLESEFVKKEGAKIRLVKQPEDELGLTDYDADNLICQEYVEFSIGDEFSWWGYRNEDGNIVSVVGQHRQKFPDKSGRVSRVALVINEEVKELGDSFVDRLDFVGICDIQFIYDRVNCRYLINEVNPRLWCCHEILEMNSIHLIQNFVDDYHSSEASQPREKEEEDFSQEWFSSLYNITNPSLRSFRCSEFLHLKSDSLRMRISAFLFIVAKFVLHGMKRKIHSPS